MMLQFSNCQPCCLCRVPLLLLLPPLLLLLPPLLLLLPPLLLPPLLLLLPPLLLPPLLLLPVAQAPSTKQSLLPGHVRHLLLHLLAGLGPAGATSNGNT